MTIKVDRDTSVVLPRGVPPPGIVVSAPVLHPSWQQFTPSMSCASLLSVTWNELVSDRSTLEWEVQWDFRLHGLQLWNLPRCPATTGFAPTITSTSGSSCRHVSQCEVGVVFVRRLCPSRWTVSARKCCPGVCLCSGSSPYLATDHTIYGLCLP